MATPPHGPASAKAAGRGWVSLAEARGGMGSGWAFGLAVCDGGRKWDVVDRTFEWECWVAMGSFLDLGSIGRQGAQRQFLKGIFLIVAWPF